MKNLKKFDLNEEHHNEMYILDELIKKYDSVKQSITNEFKKYVDDISHDELEIFVYDDFIKDCFDIPGRQKITSYQVWETTPVVFEMYVGTDEWCSFDKLISLKEGLSKSRISFENINGGFEEHEIGFWFEITGKDLKYFGG